MSNKKSSIAFLIAKIFAIIICILTLLFTVVLFIFRHEIRSLWSLEKDELTGLYSMTYYGDYDFDDFLKIGASSDSDIEKFVMKRLLKGFPLNLNITGAGCTAFTAETPDGDRLYARNFDFEYAPPLVLHTKPRNGYASVSTVNLAFEGYDQKHLPEPKKMNSFLTLSSPYVCFDGMNEKGVAMALLAVPYANPPKDENRIMLNTTTAIRLVLDYADSVDSAVELLSQYTFYFSGNVPCHFLIADKSGKSALVEFVDNEQKVTYPSEGRTWQTASNFIVWNGMNVGEGSTEFYRDQILCDALAPANGILTENEALDTLYKARVLRKNRWAVLYNLTDGTASIYVAGDKSNIITYSVE